ncbi:MAG: TolC family protein, partial [Planctomycetota bacterium]|nr:TolC family protein [Planctomycetota bacterium]
MRVLALLLVPALACRTPAADPPAPEVRVPAAWVAGDEEGTVVTGAWWADFAEPALDAVVREALEHNRDLAAASARVFAAEAQARIVGADRKPLLDASGSWARDQRVLVGLPFPGGTARSLNSTYAVGLNVTWEADLWGRLAAREGAARGDLAATAWERVAARESIAAQTAKAWIVWQEARLQNQLAAEPVASFRRNTDVVRRRYERGLVGALDLRLAESNTASAEALVELRREEVERSRRTLEILMGRYPEGGTEPFDFMEPIGLPDVPPRPPAGLPAELLRR